jgi:hypothetical protein
MHVRNWLHAPPFIMYYLTFLLPEATTLLEAEGLQVSVVENTLDLNWPTLRLVVAQKPARPEVG